jgi:hypothetical protein
MGVRIVDQVFRNGQTEGLTQEDILCPFDSGRTPIRMFWSSMRARDAAARKRILLRCWLGATDSAPLPARVRSSGYHYIDGCNAGAIEAGQSESD